MKRSPLPLLAAAAAAAITALVFLPVTGNRLLRWDDHANLVENTRWQGFDGDRIVWMFTTTHKGPYQPLSWLSYAVDHAIWGAGPAEPWGFYVTNLLLQALAAALLALCAWRLLPRAVPALAGRPAVLAWAAGGAAVLWACHPLRAESVAWATERRDVLSGVFLLGSLLAWLAHTENRPDASGWWRSRAWHFAFLLFACSLLSKATAMGWPLVLLLLDRWPLGRRGARALVAEKAPFLVASAALAVVAWMGQSATGAVVDTSDVSSIGRVVIAGHAAAFYLWKTLVPWGLQAHYQRGWPFDPWQTHLLLGLFATAGLTLFAAARRNVNPVLFVSWSAYLLLLAPVCGLTLTGSHLVADRYSHQPAIVLSLLAAGAVAWAVARTPRILPPGAAAVGAVLLLSGVAWAGNLTARTWKDDATLWSAVLRHEPENWVAHEQLAAVAAQHGDIESSVEHLTRSLASLPGRPKALTNLAGHCLNLGRLEDAAKYAEAALVADRTFAPAWRVTGRLMERAGRHERAEEMYRKALDLDPRDVETLKDLAEHLHDRDRGAEAEEILRTILELDPGQVEARVFLGSLLAGRGDRDGARALYEEALDLDPRSTLALSWLAGLHVTAGEHEKAEALFLRVLEITPDDTQTLGQLSGLLARRGAFGPAISHCRRAAELLPDQAGPHVQLAGLLLAAERRDEARDAARRALEIAQRTKDGRAVTAATQILQRTE